MPAARHAAPPVPHCLHRAKERYGLDLERRDLRNICRLIQNNQGKLDSRNPSGTTSWLLTYRETAMRVVISPDFYKVVTFLPLTDAGKYRPARPGRRRVYKHGKLYYEGDRT